MSIDPGSNPSPAPADPASLVSGTPAPAPAVVDPAKPVEGAKPVETPAPAAPEPLTWEALKTPGGFQVDDDAKKGFLETLNDAKLSPAERAQKLIDLQTGLMSKAAEASYKMWTDQQTAWQDEVRADPAIGGDKLEPALGEVSKLVDKYGSPEVRQILDATGAGNNIHIIRMLHNMAKDLGEGGPVSGAPAVDRESLADRMYPSMKKQGA